MPIEFLDGRLIVKTGDITDENVDAIVNAANWTLLGGGGVDGAIHRRGGPEIYAACKQIRETQFPDGLPTGKAVITTGGNLLAKYVIHTVGPNGGQDADLLAHSYRNAIRLAVSKNLDTIAFPSISTGAFGYPKHKAAPVVLQTIIDEIKTLSAEVTITLVFFSELDMQDFVRHCGL